MIINSIIVAAALSVPRPCVYNYFYDNGIKETYCILIAETDSYLLHGDFIDDRVAILDCSEGIKSLREKITKSQPSRVYTVASQCFQPQNWQLQIIKEIYKNTKLLKKAADKKK